MKLYKCSVTIKLEVFINASSTRSAEEDVRICLDSGVCSEETIEHVSDPEYEVKCEEA